MMMPSPKYCPGISRFCSTSPVSSFTLRIRDSRSESLFGLLGQFQEAVLPNDDAFAEILSGDIAILQHLAGLQLHLADTRFQIGIPFRTSRSIPGGGPSK